MKFVWLIVLAIIAWRLFSGRWPWQPGAKAVRARAKARARQLLGVPPGASQQEIIEAHRRLVAMVHPDRGGRNEDVHAANEARDILLGERSQHPQE